MIPAYGAGLLDKTINALPFEVLYIYLVINFVDPVLVSRKDVVIKV